VFHASASGKQTLDQGERGGNPFASALIELLNQRALSLSQLLASLKRLTETKSRGFQSADVPTSVSEKTFSLRPVENKQRRIALVLVVSDYSRSGGAQSLPGAKNDAERIASALRKSGFRTEVALDFGLQTCETSLLILQPARSILTQLSYT
jgi:Caspase domain